jgi:hypothetical protein
LLIFQNWKFTVGIGKGHWLVTLSWNEDRKKLRNDNMSHGAITQKQNWHHH